MDDIQGSMISDHVAQFRINRGSGYATFQFLIRLNLRWSTNSGFLLVNLGFWLVGQSSSKIQISTRFEVSGRFPEAKSVQEDSNGQKEVSKG